MKISLIVPVYNTPKFYLENCLLNIHCQDYKDFECIIVCDGSPKETLKICKDYTKADKRFKLFEQRNMGVSAARNLGISKAKGDYIYFIDSDDVIEPGFVKDLVNIQEQNKNSLIQARTVTVNKIEDLKPKTITTLTKEFDVIKTFSRVVWTFLYNRNLIIKNNIRFAEINHYEDALFNLEYFNVLDVDSVIKCPTRYIQIERRNSLSHSDNKEARKIEIKKALDYLKKYDSKKLTITLRYKLESLIKDTEDILSY